jgi:hypothetical protein
MPDHEALKHSYDGWSAEEQARFWCQITDLLRTRMNDRDGKLLGDKPHYGAMLDCMRELPWWSGSGRINLGR